MNRNTRYIIGATVILLSLGRFWNIKQEQKARQKQQQMIRDLSTQQLQERIEREKKIESAIPTIDLDSTMKSLEEIGKDLEEISKNLEKMDKDIDLGD